MFTNRENFKRIISKKIFRSLFKKESLACPDDDERFYIEFIKEVKEQCEKMANDEEQNQIYRLIYKRDQNQNTDKNPVVEYFVLGMTIAAGSREFFTEQYISYIFIVFILFSILVVMISRERKAITNATEIAFLNLCLQIIEEHKKQSTKATNKPNRGQIPRKTLKNEYNRH